MKFVKKWWPPILGLILTIVCLVCPIPALRPLAAISQTNSNPSGQGPNGTTFGFTAIPATSTAVPLIAPSGYITIVNTSTSVTLFYSSLSPATTTTSFAILPNASYSYGGVPLTQFFVIGSTGSTDKFSYTAH